MNAIRPRAAQPCLAELEDSPVGGLLLGFEERPGGGRVALRAAELSDLGAGSRMLDVPSGSGATARLLARELAVHVAGAEPDSEAVRSACREASAQGLSGLTSFTCAEPEGLPFEDGTFDTVLSECALCAVEARTEALSEMVRVLRPGGRLAIADVSADQARLPAALRGTGVRALRGALEPGGAARLVERLGLAMVAHEHHGQELVKLAERVRRGLKLSRNLGLKGAPVDEALELLRHFRRALDEGALGYELTVAERPL